MICLIAWGLFKAAVVWTVSGLAAVTPVLFEVGVEDDLILWQRQIVVLLRDILCLGGLCARDFFIAGCMSLDIFYKDMPALQVKPTMSLKYEFWLGRLYP